MVAAARVLQRAVLPPPHDVARAVHAAAVRVVRAGDEALRGQAGTVVVAAGEAGAGDVELAEGALGHRAQGAVEHVHLRVGQRDADRRRAAGARGEGGRGGPDGGLRGAVEVGESDGVLEQRVGELLGQRLPADQGAQPGEVGGVAGDQALPQARRGLHEGAPAERIRPASAAGSRTVSRAATTSRAPAASGTNSSRLAMSKPNVVTARKRSSAPTEKRARMSTTRLASAPCGTTTPLGRPVEPEV